MAVRHRGVVFHQKRPSKSVGPTYNDTDTSWLLTLNDQNALQWKRVSEDEVWVEWELQETPLLTTHGSEIATMTCLNAQMLPKVWPNYNAFHDSYRRTAEHRQEYYQYTGDNPGSFTGYTSNSDFAKHSKHVVKNLAESYQTPMGSDWAPIINVNVAGEIQLSEKQVDALNVGWSPEPVFTDLMLRLKHLSEVQNGLVTYTFMTYYNSRGNTPPSTPSTLPQEPL